MQVIMLLVGLLVGSAGLFLMHYFRDVVIGLAITVFIIIVWLLPHSHKGNDE